MDSCHQVPQGIPAVCVTAWPHWEEEGQQACPALAASCTVSRQRQRVIVSAKLFGTLQRRTAARGAWPPRAQPIWRKPEAALAYSLGSWVAALVSRVRLPAWGRAASRSRV